MDMDNDLLLTLSSKYDLEPEIIRSLITDTFKHAHRISFNKKTNIQDIALNIYYNFGEEAFYHFGGIIHYYLRNCDEDSAGLWNEFLLRMNLSVDFQSEISGWHSASSALNSASNVDDFLLQGGFDLFTVTISKEDILHNDIAYTLEVLNSLLESRERVQQFCGRVIITVDGYDDDPRELFEINEVRSFLKKLDHEFPYWFYFIVRDDGGSNLGFLSRCLCDWNKISPGLGNYKNSSLSKFLLKGFAGLNYITVTYNIPESENERIGKEVMTVLGLKIALD